jgi:Domain of unknown function (DUF3387)
MGEPALRVIATELVKSIKSNVSVDWMHREAARARMRVLVKRLLACALPLLPTSSVSSAQCPSIRRPRGAKRFRRGVPGLEGVEEVDEVPLVSG